MANVDADFTPGQVVRFAAADAVVVEASRRNGGASYLKQSSDARLPMWLPTTLPAKHQRGGGGADDLGFVDRSLHPVVVDCAGPFADLRYSRTPASDGAGHRLEFGVHADDVRALLTAFQIDQDNEGDGRDA